MSNFDYKLETELLPKINKIQNIQILELGVQKGRSTIKFLQLCKNNNGKLFSVDIDDCSRVSKDENWTFLQSRDDNFNYIKSIIKSKIDVLFIDTLHEAQHVEKLIYNYFPIININGFIFIDDISHLPYLNNKKRNNFYCEINNKETFNKILDIYINNTDNIDLNFSFISSRLAIFKKKSNNLNKPVKILTREFSIKNIFRKIWKKIKKI
jgi:predicted O-methyltransferase YrrM